MFEGLYAFFNGLWVGFCDFLLEIVYFIADIPAVVIVWFIDFWCLYRDFMLNAALRMVVYFLSLFSYDSNFFEVNYTVIHEFLNKIDYFFPVNHFIAVSLFLIQSYVIAKLGQIMMVFAIRFLLFKKI